MKYHPGISIHHIAIGGGLMAAVFAIGSCLIFFFRNKRSSLVLISEHSRCYRRGRATACALQAPTCRTHRC